MNSFAGIFWLVLAQLQNHFFIEHLPVAAYVRFLKEKDILLCGITRFSRGNKNKLRTFQPQKWKKLRTASLKQNLLVLIKKRVWCHRKLIFLNFYSFHSKTKVKVNIRIMLVITEEHILYIGWSKFKVMVRNWNMLIHTR